MHRDAAPRHHQVDRLIVLRLGEPHRLLVEQHARLAQAGAEAGEIFQRADAAVDVDGGVGFGVAGILDRDAFVLGAVGSERIGDRTEQLRARSIVQCAQGPLPLLARKRERAPRDRRPWREAVAIISPLTGSTSEVSTPSPRVQRPET